MKQIPTLPKETFKIQSSWDDETNLKAFNAYPVKNNPQAESLSCRKKQGNNTEVAFIVEGNADPEATDFHEFKVCGFDRSQKLLMIHI